MTDVVLHDLAAPNDVKVWLLQEFETETATGGGTRQVAHLPRRRRPGRFSFGSALAVHSLAAMSLEVRPLARWAEEEDLILDLLTGG